MGKGSKPTIGFWYRVAYHHGITTGPIDAFLEFRGGDKVAWKGELTSSGTINVNAPYLWGGEKDQGGIVGALDVMFGEADQAVNPYLYNVFGPKTCAWRGFTTVAFKGGRYGAMNPYPQKPSYKFRQIKNGWDGECWYPEKAEVPVLAAGSMPVGSSGWEYQQLPYHANPGRTNLTPPTDGWQAGGTGPFADSNLWTRTPDLSVFWIRKTVSLSGSGLMIHAAAENGCVLFVNGQFIGASNPDNLPIDSNQDNPVSYPVPAAGDYEIVVKAYSESLSIDQAGNYLAVSITSTSLVGANPAHVLYYSRTNSEMGREAPSSINEASLKAAADRLYGEGFGICPKWNPASESVEDFEKRICKLIGGSFNRSVENGQWYLDLARGDYNIDDLPILTDDDILDFKEQPSILDNAVNSVSVSYFDPNKKETIVSAPVRALALVASFGTIHQTNEYPEIPTDALAVRVAQRDMLATATPTRAFDLVTNKVPYAWRPNQYFRLQAPKRGIADMVCIVGDLQTGTLKSGAIRMKAAQDIYNMPATSFVDVEPGVDARPAQTPAAITLQRAIEAPYIEVASMLSRADLAALPADVGYAMAVAADPGNLDYTMMVSPDGSDYADAGRGDWCATAVVIEAADQKATDFTIQNGLQLDQIAVGMGALWDDEIVRVDVIDADAGTITLGRGCADTVPDGHAAGSRLWFYSTAFAYDTSEYTDGETINIKLLSNTGSQQLPLDAATALPITFSQRQARPYPPAHVQINGFDYPMLAPTGDITLTWARRNRVLQADQIIDTAQSDIAPEDGQTTTVRIFGENDASLRVIDDIAGTDVTYTGADEADDAGSAVVEDPYWANVTSLLNFDLANGTSAFNDDQGNAWTCSGSTAVSTANPIFGTGSLLVPNNGYCRSTAAILPSGTGSYTLECFITPDVTNVVGTIISCRDGVNGFYPHINGTSNGGLVLYLNTANVISVAGAGIEVGKRSHVELDYDGSTHKWYLFCDGVLLGSYVAARSTNARRVTLGISSYAWNSVQYQGRIDSFRLTPGVVRHTNSFTPPAAALGRYVPAPVTGLNGRLRFEIESARDGLVSAQHHDLTIYRPGYGNSYGLFYGDAP